MFSIEPYPLPADALLAHYQKSGAYTDCYQTEIPGTVTQAQYIDAFYGTAIFKLERLILKYLVAKPSSDSQLKLLAQGKTKTFAAWHVEKRCHNQILMCDYQNRTRSWLMVEALGGEKEPGTRLYFGSAVVAKKSTAAGKVLHRPGFLTRLSSRALLEFHRFYSVILLSAAKSRLLKTPANTSD